MSQLTVIRLIVRGYFVAALYFSFTHIITAAERLGAKGAEAVATPIMIDGFFVLGAILRADHWSSRTRRIGLWVQTAAGAASIAGNVFAASSTFGIIFGAALPFFVVFTEWLADARQLRTAAAEAEELAAKLAAELVAAAQAAEAAKRDAVNAAARTRRQARKDEKERAERAENLRIRKATKTIEAANI